MKILNVTQKSPEWRAVRAQYPCASEAPVVMGAGKHMSRSELLRMKSRGAEKQFSDYVQRMVLDKGNAAESDARELLEVDLGEDLYPLTALSDDGRWLASFDGCPMSEVLLFEHKLWNEDLAAQIRAGELGPEYFWQLEHQLLVCRRAERVIFVCSDGTRERWAQLEYRRVPGRAEQLVAGWDQFAEDLAAGNFVDTPTPRAVAQPMEELPAVSVRLDGEIAIVDNLEKFGDALRLFVARIPEKPASDQEFADCEEACKRLKTAEQMLTAAEANALASIAEVEEMRRTIAGLLQLASSARLGTDRLVKARKTAMKEAELQRGRDALIAHLRSLNARLGAAFLNTSHVPADFPAAIYGLKKFDNLRDAIDATLAAAKIEANRLAAEVVEPNLRTLSSLSGDLPIVHLFPDLPAIATMPREDFRRLAQERIDLANKAQQARTAAAPAPAPAGNVVPISRPEPQRAASSETPTLTLGAIKAWLAPLSISGEGLELLGFAPIMQGKAMMYREGDKPAMCAALIGHLERLRDGSARNAAA